jgi:hypothetical protein
VLAALTKSRDVGVLGTLKARAWEALLEMARWRTTGWSGFPREILARIAGIPEERVMPLAFGPAAPFMEAIGAR